MERIYKTGEAAKYINMSVRALQELDRRGKLTAHRNQNNHRYYFQSQLDDWLNYKNDNKPKKQVAYARVSSPHQKNNLKDQMDYIRNYVNAKGIILDDEIYDIGSGLNYKRPKWNKLLKDVEACEIAKIYITYKDRFIRFGFDWFADFCKNHGCEIVILNNPTTSPAEEITQDLMSIIHIFSCRVYGLRKYKTKIKVDLIDKKGNKHD